MYGAVTALPTVTDKKLKKSKKCKTNLGITNIFKRRETCSEHGSLYFQTLL